jgi:acetolactate synthase-1/3 small subunit
MSSKTRRHIISVTVRNESSVLSRVAGLFAGRGYNIESLTVAPIPNEEFSRITIETIGDQKTVDQIEKQLNKLIPVLKVVEREDFIEQEIAMAKFPVETNLAELDALCRTFNGKISIISENGIIATISDHPIRVGAFITASSRFSPIEIIRSGVVAMEP